MRLQPISASPNSIYPLATPIFTVEGLLLRRSGLNRHVAASSEFDHERVNQPHHSPLRHSLLTDTWMRRAAMTSARCLKRTCERLAGWIRGPTCRSDAVRCSPGRSNTSVDGCDQAMQLAEKAFHTACARPLNFSYLAHRGTPRIASRRRLRRPARETPHRSPSSSWTAKRHLAAGN